MRSRLLTHSKLCSAGLAATLLISALITAQVKASPPALTTARVEAWLSAHQGVQRFTLNSRGGLTGRSSVEVQVTDDSVEIWEERDALRHGGLALDDYYASHKRYQRASPFALLSATIYRVKAGEAQAGAWRADQPGSAEGRWVSQAASLLRRAERRGPRVTLKLAERLWTQGLDQLPLSAPETLAAHLGFSMSDGVDPIKLMVLQWGHIEPLTFYLSDRRLTPSARAPAEWVELLEVKVVSASGEASRLIQTPAGSILRVATSDQLSLLPKESKSAPPLTAQLLSQRGRLSERALQAAMRPAGRDFERCSERYNPRRDQLTQLTLRVHLTPSGSLSAVGLKEGARWGRFERCVAAAVTRLTFSKPKGGASFNEYPLRFKPSR